MCFSTILSRVLDKYFVYMPPTPLSNGPSVNKVLSCLVLLIKVNFGGTFSGAPWLIPHLRHLRIPIPKTLGHTLYSAHLKPFGRKLLIKTHWAPRLFVELTFYTVE